MRYINEQEWTIWQFVIEENDFPVIGNEFRHNIIKVVCVSLWQFLINIMINNRTDALKNWRYFSWIAIDFLIRSIPQQVCQLKRKSASEISRVNIGEHKLSECVLDEENGQCLLTYGVSGHNKM